MSDRTVVVRLVAQVTGYTAGIAQAEAATSRFSATAVASSARSRAALSTLGTAAIGMGAGILAGFAVSAKAAMNFETAMAGVSTTVKASPAQFAALAAGIRRLATEMPVTRESIAGVVEEAGKLGVARGDLLGFAKSMEQVGASTDLSAKDAARALVQLSTATQLPITEVPKLGSALVALGNDSKAGESKILTSAQSIAGAGHLIGLSTPEILAFGTAVAGLGGGGQAGLAITRLFTQMDAAVVAGGDKLTKFAAVAGMTSTQFASEFKTNASAAILSFLTGLDGISKHGGDALATLNDLSLGGSRGARIIAGLAVTHAQLAHSLGVSSGAFGKNTAATTEANQRWSTTAAQLKILENRLSDAAVSMGQALLPVLKSVVSDITPVIAGIAALATAFGHLPSPVRDAVVALGLMVGVGLIAGGSALKLAATIGKLRDAYIALKGAEAGAGLGGALAGGSSILTGTLAGIGGGSALAGGALAGGVAASVATAAVPLAMSQGGQQTISQWKAALEGTGKAAEDARAKLQHYFDMAKKMFDAGDTARAHGYEAAIIEVSGSLKNGHAILDSHSSSLHVAGRAANFAADAYRQLGGNVSSAAGSLSGASAASSALAGALRFIGAASLSSIGGVDGLIRALAGLQGIQIGIQVQQDSVFSSIDSALGKSGGGGGGGGGAAKTMADMLSAARKVPDAMRAVQDSQGKVIAQAFTLRDAYKGVADATIQVTRAQQALHDANVAQSDAVRGVAAAEKNLQNVLHGVSASSPVAQTAKRTATDTGLNVQEAQLGLRTAKLGVTNANKNVDEAAAIFGRGTKPYQDAVAAREQANIDLVRAQETLNDATKAHTLAEKDLTDTLHGAAPASEKVKQANQQLKDARKALRDATNNQIDAERSLRDASENTQKATEALRLANIDMSRATEDAVRAQQDLVAAMQAGSKAMGGGGAAAQKMKGQLDQTKQSILQTATQMGDLALKTHAAGGFTRAYINELTTAKAYADKNYGPNNPLSIWLTQTIAQYRNWLVLLGQIANAPAFTNPSAPRVSTGPAGGSFRQRAAGGPVEANGSYWVGEHGPELVTFAKAGVVHDHPSSMAAWNNARAVHVQPQPSSSAGQGATRNVTNNIYAVDVQEAVRALKVKEDRENAISLST